jgi:hypothetical protein
MNSPHRRNLDRALAPSSGSAADSDRTRHAFYTEPSIDTRNAFATWSQPQSTPDRVPPSSVGQTRPLFDDPRFGSPSKHLMERAAAADAYHDYQPRQTSPVRMPARPPPEFYSSRSPQRMPAVTNAATLGSLRSAEHSSYTATPPLSLGPRASAGGLAARMRVSAAVSMFMDSARARARTPSPTRGMPEADAPVSAADLVRRLRARVDELEHRSYGDRQMRSGMSDSLGAEESGWSEPAAPRRPDEFETAHTRVLYALSYSCSCCVADVEYVVPDPLCRRWPLSAHRPTLALHPAMPPAGRRMPSKATAREGSQTRCARSKRPTSRPMSHRRSTSQGLLAKPLCNHHRHHHSRSRQCRSGI